MKAIYKKGFSLVELLVVITIIAILSVVAYTAVGGQTVKARDAKRKQDLTTIQNALEIYANEFGTYPTALVNGSTAGQIPRRILSTIPVDPGQRGVSYVYSYRSADNTYLIGATLEVDGNPANYESYVVGNSDTALSTNNSDIGYFYDVTQTPPFTLCNNGLPIVSGNQISTTVAGGPGGTSCVPYYPNN